ncbi:aminotransferase class IV [Streptomyces ossamyceticus]|uniref:aminotransferase class IV n=1 Tax=Streptomyces ossamyceticus TaxID=249581 RepID=UPI003EC0DDF3
MQTEIHASSFSVWHPCAGLVAEENAESLVVADSWLLADGKVRAYEMHWARFTRAVGEFGVEPGAVRPFRAEVTETLPRTGTWFPRLELLAGTQPRLALRVRPAPPLRERARVRVADVPDPRTRPDLKGPDFPLLEPLRRRAQERGADEAVLLDEHGRALEGAFSSLLWWQDDVLCTPAEDGRILPGVTRRLLLDRAERLGVTVRHTRATPAELAGREVWITSALHGIRAVIDWGPGFPAPPAPTRVDEWRAHLTDCLAPLPRH